MTTAFCTFTVGSQTVNFCLPQERTEQFLEKRLPLKDFRILEPERTWTGVTEFGIAFPTHGYPKRPDLELNHFFYPTHASRWAEFNGLVDQTNYDLLAKAAYQTSSSTGIVSGTFTMSQTDAATNTTQTVSTPMYCLPPRPLAKADSTTGLYLVTLVDSRWYLQWSNVGNLSSGATTWDSLLSTISSVAQVSVTGDTVSSFYGQPNTHSGLVAKYGNTAMILDAIAANTGRVVVRNMNGSLRLQNTTSAKAAIPTTVPTLLAGGDLTATLSTDGSNNITPNAILPKSVTVVFPFYVTNPTAGCPGYKNPDALHVPFAQTTGDVYVKTVLLTDVFPSTIYSGFLGTKVFYTTAEAYVALPTDGTPTNTSDITNLAKQIATDYYTWQLLGVDETIPGIWAWTPEGANDITWVWERDRCFTRLQRKPYNFEVEDLQHHLVFSGTMGSCISFTPARVTSSVVASQANSLNKVFNTSTFNWDDGTQVENVALILPELLRPDGLIHQFETAKGTGVFYGFPLPQNPPVLGMVTAINPTTFQLTVRRLLDSGAHPYNPITDYTAIGYSQAGFYYGGGPSASPYTVGQFVYVWFVPGVSSGLTNWMVTPADVAGAYSGGFNFGGYMSPNAQSLKGPKTWIDNAIFQGTISASYALGGPDFTVDTIGQVNCRALTATGTVTCADAVVGNLVTVGGGMAMTVAGYSGRNAINCNGLGAFNQNLCCITPPISQVFGGFVTADQGVFLNASDTTEGISSTGPSIWLRTTASGGGHGTILMVGNNLRLYTDGTGTQGYINIKGASILGGGDGVTGGITPTTSFEGGICTDLGTGSFGSAASADSSDFQPAGCYLTCGGNLSEVTDPVASCANIGAMRGSNNLSDVSDVPTSRTNLGLDSAALHPDTDFCQTANNLGDVASASASCTNLGALQIANALSELSGSASTACGNIQALFAGNNLADVSSASAACTNLGSVQTSNNLADLADLSAADGNLTSAVSGGTTTLTFDAVNPGSVTSLTVTNVGGRVLSWTTL